MRDVLLVCMPFGAAFSPSIALSLLHAGLARNRISSGVRYFTIGFAERIGQAFYCRIAGDGGPPVEYLAGEWLFSAALNDLPPDEDERYMVPAEALANGLRLDRCRIVVSQVVTKCIGETEKNLRRVPEASEAADKPTVRRARWALREGGARRGQWLPRQRRHQPPPAAS